MVLKEVRGEIGVPISFILNELTQNSSNSSNFDKIRRR